MSEIKLLPCPFCSKGFRRNCSGAYEHYNEECILHGLEICNEAELKKWNTRKPMQEILERLEEERKDCVNYDGLNEEYYFGKMQGFEHAIEIVKEVGEDNAT